MKSSVLCFLVVAIALGEKQIENWKVDTFGDKNFVQVDQNDSFTGPIVRKKRFVGVTLLTIGLIASATATAVSTIDQETDSEAFYPSIRTHKNTIRFYARRIQEKVPSLQRQVRNIEDKLQIARNTERNMNHWLTTMSKIKNLTEVHNLQLEDTDFVIPASVSNQIPLFNKIMTPVSYAFLGLQTYGTVQAVSSTVAGTLSATSAAFTGIGGVLAIVGSGVTIGITLNNGANKRDQYRDIATNYQAQFERLDEADRNLTALWTNFRTFMIDIQNKVEAIVTEDLRTTCSVGVHGEAIPDLVQALDSNWITILNGFIHLDEKYRQIKQQINFQIDNGATAQETFLGIYRNHRDQSAFIIDAMKQAGIAENTFGRWGPWRNRTPCTETDCGVRMKTRNRRCLTGSCIGNTFQKVVCSVNRDREESCDAMPTSTIPTYINTRAYSYYSAVIKHICALSTDYVQYQGMNDAFTVRPTATVQQPHAITW